jgi:hypothetical protein
VGWNIYLNFKHFGCALVTPNGDVKNAGYDYWAKMLVIVRIKRHSTNTPSTVELP